MVTGAKGFVGSALCRRLQDSGCLVRGALRETARCSSHDGSTHDGIEWVILHDQSSEEQTRQSLKGVEVIIHLAARVHVMADTSADPLHEFRKVNVVWTERLARTATAEGVRRFVYLSSIKVNGEQSMIPFTERDLPNPQGAYGRSKWEAEQALAMVSSQTGLETVVIRSPLVYGPGVGGNFLQLLNFLEKGIPLPLAGVENRRSLIYRGNLVDALSCCVHGRLAAGQTYLISDGEDLSTPELIRRLGKALEFSACLWPLPLSMLCGIGQLIGKQAVFDRLLRSLQVDSSKIRKGLDWHPPFSVDQGLAETATWFRARTTNRSMVS
ncbi:MAG: NAD-dependent epimerase/dehydratase family protein [Nitrospira sp.]|nr:NAD-dependent epimerase/dehydratase family protein [Nitrospira sp.]TKB93832.1 MAG: NAD-dependent epimerase/dehydratase family protein [Nitrospira sp.]